MKKTIIAAALAGAALFATPASAATLTIGDGQTGCESGNQSVFDLASCDVGGAKDLSNAIATPDNITFLGSGFLTGYLMDAAGVDPAKFPDYAQVTLSVASLVTVELANPDATFDALVTFGSDVSAVLDFTTTSVSFASDAGTFLFGINATAPFDNRFADTSSYKVSVTNLAAVPLPAGAVLLLTGLGGLAVARRKAQA